MPDLRALVLAAIIAGLIGTATRGDVILTLGVESSGSLAPASNPVSSSSSSGGGFPLFLATSTGPAAPSSATSLNLATSDPTSSNINSPAPAPSPTPSPIPMLTPSSAPSQPSYDAFINLGAAPMPNANTLTTGNALPWYDSQRIIGLFGGQPNAQQQQAFDNTVLQRVEQTFALSGVPVKLTDDPTASAAHTLSVVSNTVNPTLGSAIGMTNLGGNGFHFIDNSAQYAGSVDQLEWIVAHNVAHELMLAFGVPEVHDQSGKYIDSTVGQMSMFLNPNATFSTGAVQALLSENFQATSAQSVLASAQLVGGSPVPEPTTWAIWAIGAFAGLEARRRSRSRSRRASA
jgi:hypothetical protein